MNDSIAENAFRERLAHYSLSELEDVLAHVDRDTFPEREKLVAREIEARLTSARTDVVGDSEATDEVAPGFLRRLGLGLVDFSIQIMIPYIVLYFVVKVIYTPLGENKFVQYLFPADEPQRAGRRGRGGSNDIWSDITGLWDAVYGFVTGVMTGQPEALSTLEMVCEYFLFYLLFRTLWTTLRVRKSGGTSGMQEVGIKMTRADGRPLAAPMVAGRFVLLHVLFIITLGISGLWMFWDRERRALHDRLLGTRLVRVPRSWEKSNQDRKLD